MLSISSVVTKYTLIERLDWISLFFWTQVISGLMVLSLLLMPKFKKEVMSGYKDFKSNSGNFVLQSLLAVGGIMGIMFAIGNASVTFIKGISSLQPFIVVLFSFIIHKFKPDFIFEGFGKDEIFKKSVFFLLTAIGVFMMIL